MTDYYSIMELEALDEAPPEAEREFWTAEEASLADSLSLGICLVGADGRVARFNEAFLDFAEPGFASGSPFDRLFDPEFAGAAAAFLAGALGAGKSYGSMEARLKRRGIWCRLQPCAVRDGALLVSLSDESERRLADFALKEAEELLRSWFRSVPAGIVFQGRDGSVLRANGLAKQMLGLGEAAPSSVHPDWKAVDADGVPLAPEDYPAARAIRTGAEALCPALGIPAGPGGEPRWLKVHAAPEFSPGDERPLRVCSIIEDVTAAVQRDRDAEAARLRAEEASRAKGDFLASVSHEIRTPLNGIVGLTGMLLDAFPRDDQARLLSMLKGSADHLLSLVNDVLDLSRIEARRLSLEALPLSPRSVAEEAMHAMAAEAARKGLALELSEGVGLPDAVLGDRLRLKQVLINLVGNALKFTERGGVSLRVSLEAGAAEPGTTALIRYAVTDTGIGIPPERASRLFERFAQADEGTARRYGGSGLGLAICRDLVTLMGGSIGLESEPGRGSVFWFAVPGAVPIPSLGSVPAETRPADTAGCPDAVSARRVLLVEDNAVNRLVGSAMVRKLGHSCDEAPDGYAALRMLASARYDLALMDIQMPGMDGVETALRMRRGEAGAAAALVPVIALTANALREDRDRYLASGMAACVTKPIREDELREAMQSAFCPGSAAPRPEPEGRPACAPSPPVGAAAQVIRRDEFRARCVEDPTLMAQILGVVEEECAKKMATLDAALAAGDGPAVSAAAHSLKGMTANLGAPQVAAVAGALESAGKSASGGRNAEDLAGLAAALRYELSLLVEDAERFADELAAETS